MDYLIGLDIGTTAIKGSIISVEGKILKPFRVDTTISVNKTPSY